MNIKKVCENVTKQNLHLLYFESGLTKNEFSGRFKQKYNVKKKTRVRKLLISIKVPIV